MRKKLTVLLTLLLAAVMLFAACGAPALPGFTPAPEDGGEGEELSVYTDPPTDHTPDDVRTTSPPESDPEPATKDEPTVKDEPTTKDEPTSAAPAIAEDGTYTSKEDVALYIHTYGKLPGNFITKKEAERLGWSGGSLEPYAPGKCIGGSYFGNYEGLLPTKPGREYHECDIDTLGKNSRGAKRLVYSNDGLIYYTGDHYETFTLLYGEE